MNLDTIKGNIDLREKDLKKLDGKNKEQLQGMLQKMQKEHQQIVVIEDSLGKNERDEIRNIRKDLENQQNQINTHFQLIYKSKAVKAAPPIPILKNCLAAFFVGGLICTLGQIILNTFTLNGFTENQAAAMTSIVLITLSALLTGIGVYDKIGKFAGAGSMVPITGFANSIVSSALEFKKEGYVYGVGYKIFMVAGPVLLYGTLVSALIGLIYYIIL